MLLRVWIFAPFLALGSVASAAGLYSSATVRSGTGGGSFSTNDSSLVTRTDTIGGFQGTASAQADFGVLHASASASSVGWGEYAYAQGYAGFGDTLTITGGTGDDYYLADFMVDGAISSTGSVQAQANLLWPNLPNGAPGGLTTGSSMLYGVYPVKFTYGVAFDIRAELYSTISISPGVVGEGTADFLNTARLAQIRIVDKSGVLVGPREISSTSGHLYAQAVPEPASMVTLAVGAVGLVRRRRKG